MSELVKGPAPANETSFYIAVAGEPENFVFCPTREIVDIVLNTYTKSQLKHMYLDSIKNKYRVFVGYDEYRHGAENLYDFLKEEWQIDFDKYTGPDFEHYYNNEVE